MGLADLASRKHRALSVAEVLLASGGIAYLNHKVGAGEIKLGTAADGTGGVPLDGTIGLAGIAFAFWKPESKFASHALAIGLGAAAGFAYRTGAALGDSAAQTAHTAGGPAQVPAHRPAPQLAAAFAKYQTPQHSRVAVSR